MPFSSDPLTLALVAMIVALAIIVGRFAAHAFEGDPRRAEFLRGLAVTGAAALAVVASGHLLVLAAAWIATSLSLHRLLVFYPERPAAAVAARVKFVISRAGDACLIGVLALTWQYFGAWDLPTLFTRVAAAGPAAQPAIHAIAILIVICAVLKSAQFPFHVWLPDTMDTPTPVSALMHAGVINAGGVLVIRMSPIVSASEPAMTLLIVTGAITAIAGAIVMVTQASVKRGLAFSTVAQMGFMLVECGVGAFGLAAWHLIAHSLYKAYAFLASGSAVEDVQRRRNAQPAPPIAIVAAPVAATALVAGAVQITHLDVTQSAGAFALAALFTTALSTFLADAWRATHTRSRVLGLAVTAGLAGVYVGLHRAFDALVPSPILPSQSLSAPVAVALIGALALAYVVHVSAETFATTRWAAALYVHARNGFYLNTLINRLTLRLWPVAAAGESR